MAKGFAEVCDKERPGWDPTTSSPSLSAELLDALVSPRGGLLVVVVLVVFLARNKRIALMASFLVIVFGAVSHREWFPLSAGADIRIAAAQEGCISSPLAGLLLFTTGAALCFFAALVGPIRKAS